MKAIQFPEANIQLAENQDQYETLPIWMDVDENKRPNMTMVADVSGNLSMQPTDPQGHAVSCFELSEDEIAEINKTGKIYLTTLTFWQPFQPIRMSVLNPFVQTEISE